MAKNPAFPFYAQDFLVDTMRWTRAMKGLHIDLLCESWINGGLKNVKGFPVGIEGADKIIWKQIKTKWTLSDGVWINAKLEEVRAARQKFIEKQSEKGKKSAAARKGMVEPQLNSGSTSVQPLERENEIEDLVDVKEGVQGKPSEEVLSDKQEIFELIFSDQRFIDDLSITHPDKDFQQAFHDCFLYFSNRPNPPNTLWQWREKLISWIIRMDPKAKNGKSTAKDKSTEHLSGLMAGFKRRNGGADPGW